MNINLIVQYSDECYAHPRFSLHYVDCYWDIIWGSVML